MMTRPMLEQPPLESIHSKPFIDQAKPPALMMGFSQWKQAWLPWFFPQHQLHFILADDVTGLTRFLQHLPEAPVFVWGYKETPEVQAVLAEKAKPLHRVEDGFIRSIGLGSRKVAPYSLAIAEETLHYDIRQASTLETLLNTTAFETLPDVLERADACMQTLLRHGINKYNLPYIPQVQESVFMPKSQRKRVLVIGQVETDNSIIYGCLSPLGQRDLLRCAIAENPDADIYYKPHPDAVSQNDAWRKLIEPFLGRVFVLPPHLPHSVWIHRMDHLYTLTSQLGFEALLYGKHVTTLGLPFYAGWGLTDDRSVLPRPRRVLSLRELFAGAYLLYPRYSDLHHAEAQPLERILALILERKHR
jgi:capsule polysaccharide export protein KpsC/LpsZ